MCANMGGYLRSLLSLVHLLPPPPSPPPLSQVLAGHPHNGQERGEHVLNCMTAIVPNLHEDLVDLWDAVVPKLLSYLNGNCVCIHYHIFFKYCSNQLCAMGTMGGALLNTKLCTGVTFADESLSTQCWISF